MTVNFYTFSKRQNSTARPTGAAAESFDCKLKDSSGVLRPTLEVYKTAAWNPTALNYAYIAAYSRYYYVSDWQWIVGRWECMLTVDVLASWKTQIGAASKYVLRAAADWNDDIVDTLYPATADVEFFTQSLSLGFIRDFDFGTYILGVANNSSTGAGAITYYMMHASDVRQLIMEMMPIPTQAWTQSFSSMTDTLFRSIYDPFSYIKSCIWLPWYVQFVSTSYVKFGCYTCNFAQGEILNNDASRWTQYGVVFTLPTGWATGEAKIRTNPGCHMYIVCNPFGTIELNPIDFAHATGVEVDVITDYMSGDALLKIYRKDGGTPGTLTFITQTAAKLGVDINLTAARSNAEGTISGLITSAGGVIAAATGGASAVATGALTAAAGIASTAESMIPSLSASTGQMIGGIAALDGLVTLRIEYQHYVDTDPQDNGFPLMKIRQLNTLSGYIKCSDGEVRCPAYADELSSIAEHLTGGFFYE